jgi:hypothetical protein
MDLVQTKLGTYALLCIWVSEIDATTFEKIHFLTTINLEALNHLPFCTCSRSPRKMGRKPFISHASLALDKPVMVLTRASIRLSKLFFGVGQVSKSLEDYDGLALSIGVGEWPLIQQATLSIWKTQAEMIDYAYKNENTKR